MSVYTPELAAKPWRPISTELPASALTTALFAMVIVSGLYFGREVLVPIALALLLSFALAPRARGFENARNDSVRLTILRSWKNPRPRGWRRGFR
jgi:predicted PurR-regulated permease PerM